MARPAGIEPATAGLEGRCSIRLSYGRFIKSTNYSANRNLFRPMLGSVQTESEVRADYIGLSRQLKRLLDLRCKTSPSGQIGSVSRPLTSRRRALVFPRRDPTARRSISNERLASSSCVGSNSHSRSRPTFVLRASPAPASTPKCLVTACRVKSECPAVSWVIDSAPPTHSSCDESQSRLVAQCRKDRRAILQSRGFSRIV